MPMVPFFTFCLETAKRETRVLTILDDDGDIPPGHYQFIELYCDEPNCDCRRVLLQVHPTDNVNQVMATITFGWESVAYYRNWTRGDPKLAEGMAGASLELFAPQGPHAQAIMDLTDRVLLSD